MSKALSNAPFWLVDTNPFNLPEPPHWWQRLVLDYDKMLRLIPSASDRCYRLCRIAKRGSRLGLKLVGDLHQHPDTVAMTKYGVVPELTLRPEAIYTTGIIATLRARDSWALYGGDPEKRLQAIEQEEAATAMALRQEHDAEQDEVLRDTFRHIRMGGYRPQIELARGTVDPPQPLKPFPTLPAALPRTLTSPPE